MTGRTGHLAAVDLGATSGRVMLATVGPGILDIRPVARFANDPVYLWNGERTAMHWDVPGLFHHVCGGLAEATRQQPDLLGIGVDSWAVDYGLLRDGALAGTALPLPRRPLRWRVSTSCTHDRLRSEICTPATVCSSCRSTRCTSWPPTGATARSTLADRALLIPDLIGYWLTGRAGHRTHQRLHHRTARHRRPLGRRAVQLLGLPPGCSPPSSNRAPIWARVLPDLAIQGGSDRSAARDHRRVARHRLGGGRGPHGPGSAVYISCGTWGLVGVELDRPVIDRGGAGRPTSPTRSAPTAESGSCAT